MAVGHHVGNAIKTLISVLVAVFIFDKLGIFEICAIWDTACGEARIEPKKTVQTTSKPDKESIRREEPAKQEKGPSLPKEFLPQITIGPWISTKPQNLNRAEMSLLISLADGLERLYKQESTKINIR